MKKDCPNCRDIVPGDLETCACGHVFVPDEPPPPAAHLRRPEVMRLAGLKAYQVAGRTRVAGFPEPKSDERGLYWIRDEVEAWAAKNGRAAPAR